MTLLEDLEAAAKIADINAEECDKSDASGAAMSCRVFASRVRGHRKRLLQAMKQSQKSNENLVSELVYWLNGGQLDSDDEE